MKIEDKGDTVVIDGKILPVYKSNGIRYFLDAVPVNELGRDEETQPRAYSEEAAKKIADSIKRKVIMQPILARYAPEGQSGAEGTKHVLIVEGQHRWRAEKDILEDPYIPAIVYLDMDISLAQRCGLEANESDRARGLSGGAFARKSYELFESRESRESVAKDHSLEVDEITEVQILNKLGCYTKALRKKYLLGWISYRLLDEATSRLKEGKYVSDAQHADFPITVKNLQFFLSRIARTKPVEVPISDAEYLRDDEFNNIKKVTDIFTDIVLAPNWKNSDTHKHNHAKNICRRHPLEAAGYFIGKILNKHGGADNMLGAVYVDESQIDWKGVERDMKDLFNSGRWDESDVCMCRSIEDLIDLISRAVSVVR